MEKYKGLQSFVQSSVPLSIRLGLGGSIAVLAGAAETSPTFAQTQANNCNVKVEVKLQAYNDLNNNNRWDAGEPIIGVIPGKDILVSTAKDTIKMVTSGQGVGVNQKDNQPYAILNASCDAKDASGRRAANVEVQNLDNGFKGAFLATDSSLASQPNKYTLNVKTTGNVVSAQTVLPSGTRVSIISPVNETATRTFTSGPSATFTNTPTASATRTETSTSTSTSTATAAPNLEATNQANREATAANLANQRETATAAPARTAEARITATAIARTAEDQAWNESRDSFNGFMERFGSFVDGSDGVADRVYRANGFTRATGDFFGGIGAWGDRLRRSPILPIAEAVVTAGLIILVLSFLDNRLLGGRGWRVTRVSVTALWQTIVERWNNRRPPVPPAP